LECLRTIDRARIRFGLPDAEVARRRSAVFEQLEGFDFVRLDQVVLERAAEPLPTVVGSLDAVHLTSALFARGQFPDLAFATHDDQLGVAARAMGFSVLGSAQD
jgi:hypothetical protein